MKRCVVTLIGLASLFALANAQERDKVIVEEKSFLRNEIQRYKTLFQSHPTRITSDESIDATYYKLELRITTSPQYLRGKVTMKAVSRENNVDSISLDLMNSMTIDSIKVGGSVTTFVQHTSSFDIRLDHSYNTGDPMTVEIYYQGVPGSSGFGSFEFSSHSSTPWVWSLSEPYGAKDWWPCKDHPSDKADSADIIVTCDSSFKVGSNGRLKSITNNGDGTVTYHWQERYPIATCLISVAITNYASFSNWFHYSPTDSMEVLNYVLPEHLSSALANLPRTIDMLTIYSSLFGLYPFVNEKYGHSEFGWGGGMEHQTMTSLGGFSEGLVAHELAHMWFGDMITCKTWPNIWLNEGFATYCVALYRERKYGTSSYWTYMNSETTYAKLAVGSIYVGDTSDVGTLFDGNLVYAKGAVVLHMLRHVLGDSDFFHAIYNYANDPSFKYGTATTEDFRSICESTSGENLGYFFNEWIYGEKYPKYSYGWTASPGKNGYTVAIPVSQTTGTLNPAFFKMPIDFKIIATGWDTTVTVFNDSATQTFMINVSHDPSAVQLDPEGWILKDFLKPFSASPAVLSFSGVIIGSSKRDSVTVTNVGAVPLNVSSVTSDLSDFAATPTSASIPVATSQKFYITFKPMTAGPKIGHVVFAYNAPGSPGQISVIGIGITPTSTYSFSKMWNMVSLPVTVTDPRKTSIFPTAVSDALSYIEGTGYVSRDSLRNGVGYWLKFDSAQAITIAGIPRSSDTIDVVTGWNLVGSISSPISVDAIASIPPGIVTSGYFGYNGSYFPADSLQPGRGYWVKISEAGKLVLSASARATATGALHDRLQLLNKLVIQDHGGNNATLYFGSGTDDLKVDKYDLPPIPPRGIFDARFSSGRMAEAAVEGKPNKLSVLISSAVYPVTIRWEISEGLVSDKSRSVAASLMIGTKEILLEESGAAQISSP